MMIPRTDTPGAKDVGIPAFIDKMLKDAYPKEEQARFFAGLADFEAQAKREHGRAFLELEPALRTALVKQVHDPAVKVDQASNLPVAERGRPFILTMKELTMLGYFISEAGATQVLQYRPVPGRVLRLRAAERRRGKARRGPRRLATDSDSPSPQPNKTLKRIHKKAATFSSRHPPRKRGPSDFKQVQSKVTVFAFAGMTI